MSDKKLTLVELIQGLAGYYNGLESYMNRENQAQRGHLTKTIVWMQDEEGIHGIEANKLIPALDQFLKAIEDCDFIIPSTTDKSTN